ncbi:hypothetical protein TESG_05158 [Trichophyton tonsurans CBS 112818]|uniref:Uncharacterized protein n=1 Tax=Trichophyton tonsurans (strain CBS 112818) TaxID=647933 RepID=F2S2F7_TRIT1|nr:hypothetical protein TESG_05158 [Trichophyton tonsurans CBS 112818]
MDRRIFVPANRRCEIFVLLMAAGCWKENSVKISPLAQILVVKDAHQVTSLRQRQNEGSDASNNPNHGSWLEKPKNGYIHAVKTALLGHKALFYLLAPIMTRQALTNTINPPSSSLDNAFVV